MSKEQKNSIVTTANMLFRQKWEVFASDGHGTDNNTPPSMTNAVRTEQYFEAMTLNTIV